MYYFLLFLLTTVFMTTSSVLAQVSKNSNYQTPYTSLSQYESVSQIGDIPADKIVGAHWWGTRSISYDENPVRLKKGQNLTISFESPVPGSPYSSYPCHVKYIVYGSSISGSNQNLFDFTKDNHTTHNLRFQASTSPGPTTINFVITCTTKSCDRDGNWHDNGTGQITSSDLQIIVEDDVE